MQITQLMTSHCIRSCQSISHIYGYCQNSGRILAKTYLEILVLRYIISDVAMDFIQLSGNRTFQNSLCGVMS